MAVSQKMWSAVAWRGLFAIILGLLALFVPGITLAALVLLFAVYALLDGIFAMVAWWRTQLGFFLVEGVINIAAGIFVLFWPSIAITIFVFLMAVWALLTGIVEIFAAMTLRKAVAKEMFLLFSGIISIVFAVLLFSSPALGAVALVFVMGLYLICFGIMLLALGFKLRRLK